ncbi:MAG TPA: VacJ family lipoprotein [Nitrosomonas sp.]|nr:VacJ family lipoprotein [Nitrosomonas sp.]HMW68780.1 VacJ family lipoprotein [Nitrosomonas sp.]HMY61980.1 VacJ family lipoprotein [Nitrosomonas sp.]HMY90324.1 VacJ family lipoprotein [Nitrosomonas sp.]HNA71090.1 VacJ family lipoprotein [Nitrosomonas sp.]
MKARCNTIILLGIFITALMACTSAPKKESLADTQQVTAHQGSNAEIHSEHSEEMPVDPYESANRKTYSFTDSIDRFILEPVADVYIDYVPYAIQRPISNFYRNLSYPNVALNAFLQGKFRQGFEDSFRFVINSTIGIFGLADMAGHMGFKENNEDFGQTLAVWGVDPGSYLFVPIYGPSNRRDILDLPIGFFTDALFYASYAISGPALVPILFLRVVDKRARLAGPMRIRDESALDPYLFVREAYTQQREYLIHDGNPPIEQYDDIEEEGDEKDKVKDAVKKEKIEDAKSNKD